MALIDYRFAPDKATSQPHSARHFAIHGDHLAVSELKAGRISLLDKGVWSD